MKDQSYKFDPNDPEIKTLMEKRAWKQAAEVRKTQPLPIVNVARKSDVEVDEFYFEQHEWVDDIRYRVWADGVQIMHDVRIDQFAIETILDPPTAILDEWTDRVCMLIPAPTGKVIVVYNRQRFIAKLRPNYMKLVVVDELGNYSGK